MHKKISSLCILLMGLGIAQANATPVYLNIDNISVAVGVGTKATTSNNTFDGGNTIDKVIDAPSAAASETHSQTSHIWYSGGGLELLFDFGLQYDLTTLHFWNYNGESYDVDEIGFTFFDATNTEVGALSIAPDLGATPNILAQDITLAAPLNVQYVTAFLTGSNDQVDFQNIGFTAALSTDRCEIDPNDPVCQVSVPEPAYFALLSLGIMGLGLRRRMSARC